MVLSWYPSTEAVEVVVVLLRPPPPIFDPCTIEVVVVHPPLM